VTKELAPGIHHVISGFVNAYLIEADDGLTIVDSGLRNRARAFVAVMKALSRSPGDVRSILITHHHVDHRGSLAALATATGATVYAPTADAAIIRGAAPAPHPVPPSMFGRLTVSVVERFAPDVQDARVDHEVADGETLPVAGGIFAIHTPGHTAGQTSYLLARDGGILFVGDAAETLTGRPRPPVRGMASFHTEDLDEAARSFRKLAALDFDMALPGHGKPILGGASDRFRAEIGGEG
jgi:glyoxylase-like metal-dependent hydrolase (beta-lactamase superfamily II)